MRILLIADYFGRDQATGAKRANAFAKHWAASPDVTVDVLSAHKPWFPENPEGSFRSPERVTEYRVAWPDLIWWRQKLQPKRRQARVEGESAPETGGTRRRGAVFELFRFFSDLVTTPDRNALWGTSAVLRGLSLKRPDVIVATGPSFINLVAGATIGRLRRVPFVADLRDPWSTNPFAPERGKLLAGLDRRLERYALGRARQIWVTTAALAREFESVLGVPPSKLRVFSNGYDEEEWEGVEHLPTNEHEITIVHTGTLYNVRSPVPFLEDLAAIRSALGPAQFARIRVLFVGYLSPELEQPVRGALRALRLEETVEFRPPRPAKRALELQAGAGLLLLVGHRSRTTSTQIPLKLYEYLRAGRPQVAYFQSDSAVAELARSMPELHIELADLENEDVRRSVLSAVLSSLLSRRDDFSPLAASVAQFERRVVANAALESLSNLIGDRVDGCS